MKYSILLLALTVVCTGCTALATKRHALNQETTSNDIRYQEVMDDLAKKVYPMPINCDRRHETFIGRIREDLSSPNGLAFWCVSDNLRKGAATNAVQIALLLDKLGPEAIQGRRK